MSSNGNCGRPWTSYEDELLRTAVEIHGDNTEKWKTIALSVPGRTNKACRKRWLHSLSPSVKKSAWTTEEDQLLLSLFEKYPNKWSRIAREIPGRTDDACSKRYREALDPNLKKDEWTNGEDRRLLDVLMRYGGPTNPKWGLIGQELRRSGLGCRNRWRLLERKRKAALRHDSAHQSQTDTASDTQQFPTDVWAALPECNSLYWPTVFESLGVSLGDFSVAEDDSRSDVMGLCGQRPEEPRRESLVTESALKASREIDDQLTGMQGGVEARPTLGINPRPVVLCVSSHPGEPQISQQLNREGTPNVVPLSSDQESANYSYDMAMSDAIDHGASQDDVFCSYDNDTPGPSRRDESGPNEEPPLSVEIPGGMQTANRLVANERENLSSLGTLAHAASTLSPSPCVPSATPRVDPIQQAVEGVIVPPRKRRRISADSSAFPGMHVIFGIAGVRKPEPKLSSYLTVAEEYSSILAYVCGHSACFSPGASASTACYATAGELMKHYKERHMTDASAAAETPFRCGLDGCNKGWKSINGLQYHLQISKVHYQNVCSRAATRKDQIVDRDSGSDANSSGSSDNAAHHTTRRLHKCPHPACLKQYKQLTGLRYHLLHGHPKDMPAQLTTVPPRIAKQLGFEAPTENSTTAIVS